jgi:site-specific recombinase XerD
MTRLAPTLQAYFTTRLTGELGASPHTVAAYRDTWRLLLRFTAQTRGWAPQQLELAQLDATLISDFLIYLQTSRGNSVTTRNARLAAIHSFYDYAALRHPEHADTIARVLDIPAKRHHRTDLTYLTPPEVTALLTAPNHDTAAGRRDHAMIQLAVTTGLRVSELTALTPADVHLGTGPHVACTGKGRKRRITPLDQQTVTTIRRYLAGLPAGTQFLFPTRTGTRMSTDAVARRLTQHVSAAGTSCPTLDAKNVSPHTLRHTAAMRLLHAGIDITVIALWLGHQSIETTQIYLHADMTTKERAMARTAPTGTEPGRYQPASDQLLTFLQSL